MAATEQHHERAANVTQLEFSQAMRDFKTMFPEVDEDVIEAVLRSNNGAVDATIDHLLVMSVDSENEKLRTELENSESNNDEVPPRYSPSTPPPSYQQAVPQVSSPTRSQVSKKTETKRSNIHNLDYSKSFDSARLNSSNLYKDPLQNKHKWKPPLIGPLPPTFLRPDYDESHRQSMSFERRGSDVSILSSAMLQQKLEENERQRQASNPEVAQFLEDERFAIFLQNEEFVQELRRNKDFMSTLELDSGKQNSGTGEHLPDGPEVQSHDSDAAFKETLRNMGKASRRKFAQLARLFSRRKRRSFQQLLGGGHGDHSGNPSRDNLLSNDDDYTELENEGSDSEDHRNSWDSHGGDDINSSNIRRIDPK
ncbi:CUE domain-containing protein 1-like protein [Dinothrombium tinctorium]|uniref:CUE domain-containing protein 1-like protein n=1 Tax=Dinothrombium tinctorium TaxID=1965070 RepID=A0A443R0D0_9ACAR|nr:CUE domain-containing protein 1-like protein [Dinothrombium tinctorium]